MFWGRFVSFWCFCGVILQVSICRTKSRLRHPGSCCEGFKLAPVEEGEKRGKACYLDTSWGLLSFGWVTGVRMPQTPRDPGHITEDVYRLQHKVYLSPDFLPSLSFYCVCRKNIVWASATTLLFSLLTSNILLFFGYNQRWERKENTTSPNTFPEWKQSCRHKSSNNISRCFSSLPPLLQQTCDRVSDLKPSSQLALHMSVRPAARRSSRLDEWELFGPERRGMNYCSFALLHRRPPVFEGESVSEVAKSFNLSDHLEAGLAIG